MAHDVTRATSPERRGDNQHSTENNTSPAARIDISRRASEAAAARVSTEKQNEQNIHSDSEDLEETDKKTTEPDKKRKSDEEIIEERTESYLGKLLLQDGQHPIDNSYELTAIKTIIRNVLSYEHQINKIRSFRSTGEIITMHVTGVDVSSHNTKKERREIQKWHKKAIEVVKGIRDRFMPTFIDAEKWSRFTKEREKFYEDSYRDLEKINVSSYLNTIFQELPIPLTASDMDDINKELQAAKENLTPPLKALVNAEKNALALQDIASRNIPDGNGEISTSPSKNGLIWENAQTIHREALNRVKEALTDYIQPIQEEVDKYETAFTSMPFFMQRQTFIPNDHRIRKRLIQGVNAFTEEREAFFNEFYEPTNATSSSQTETT